MEVSKFLINLKRFENLKIFICCLLVLFSYLPVSVQSQSISSNPTPTLKVGVAIGDPFATTENNEFYGIAIDIWKLIAEEQNLKYQFVSVGEHIDNAVSSLAQGNIDVLIGPIVPTFERNKLVDFMQPFYLNQIGLVVALKEVDFMAAMGRIFNSTISTALLIFIGLFVFYLHVFWYFERRHNPEVPREYFAGIKKTFWLHTLDIDLGKIPTHTFTKCVRFFWLILVTLFFSSITAALTSALTIALSEDYENYNNLSDFKNKKIAAVIDTAPYDIAKEAGLKIIPFNNREEAIDALLKGKVFAYADYYPTAVTYIDDHQLKEKLTLANYILRRNTFAFALPLNSPLRHPLNLKLSSKQNLGLIKPICEKYFRDNQKSADDCEI